jgi:uncharacterized protein YecT (DUF1311 family)
MLSIIRSATVLSLILIGTGVAQGMDFDVRPYEGRRTIFGDGPIVDGDADRLATAISRADRDQFGNIPIFLNSPGGSVAAALELVKLMDRVEFSPLVGSGAECASACASIVYISARYHLVIGSGRIGLHTCYAKDASGRAPEPSAFCNEAIRENAVRHGTSYSAIRMWDDYAPGEMAWFDARIACEIGLCGPPGFDRVLAFPSFDCRKAMLESEKRICSDKRLARHEASMAKTYAEALAAAGSAEEKGRLREAQRKWLATRDNCDEPGLIDCLLQALDNRQQALLRFVIDAQNAASHRR